MPHIGFIVTHAPPLTVQDALEQLDRPVHVTDSDQGRHLYNDGQLSSSSGSPLLGTLPPALPVQLGCASFRAHFGLRYAYVAGSMAKGIASVDLVKALSNEGMLAFFGAGGLDLADIRHAITRLQQELGDTPWGVNLIHSPTDPLLEEKTVSLLLERQVRLVEAAAFMSLTLPLVRYRTSGIYRDTKGRVCVPNRVFGKVSREEIAEKFCQPPPMPLLQKLHAQGELSTEQVDMAQSIPMVDALIAEADSGGHTDNRPLVTLLPTIMSVRDRFRQPGKTIHVGCGGGIGTPQAAAAAFAMGADFIVTGTVNQACCEAGTSNLARQMLAEARQADIAMAPAADMFEMGGKVQVLKRGTMFSMRAGRLYELYRSYSSWQQIDDAERAKIETQFFRMSFDEVWQHTQAYFASHDPAQVERARTNEKHKMALVFRWYLGQTPHWANQGVEDRRIDYQIWCGPAMGAFNEWTKGSFLEQPEHRRVATVALNLLTGAARLTRLNQLRALGIETPPQQSVLAPMTLNQLKESFN